MLTIEKFYAPKNITRKFWYYGGSIYTIVPGRHIGVDYGYGAVGDDEIPALMTGKVVLSTTTRTLGGVVVVKTNHPTHPYLAYCHLYNGDMIGEGVTISAGKRVGRMAKPGESTGSAWDGRHTHIVMSDMLHGAYLKYAGASKKNYLDVAAVAKEIINGKKPIGRPAATGANQRIVRVARTSGRAAPTTSAKINQYLTRNTIANFDAFIRGENLTQNGVTTRIWYRGAFSGDWFWAGNFTEKSARDLVDLGTYSKPKPKPKKKYVRLTGGAWYVYRTSTDAAAGRVSQSPRRIPAGEYLWVKTSVLGPRQIHVGNELYWVGTARTRPPIIKK